MRINHGRIWADARKAGFKPATTRSISRIETVVEGFKPSRTSRTTNRIRRTIQHSEAQETQQFRRLVTPRHADQLWMYLGQRVLGVGEP